MTSLEKNTFKKPYLIRVNGVLSYTRRSVDRRVKGTSSPGWKYCWAREVLLEKSEDFEIYLSEVHFLLNCRSPLKKVFIKVRRKLSFACYLKYLGLTWWRFWKRQGKSPFPRLSPPPYFSPLITRLWWDGNELQRKIIC